MPRVQRKLDWLLSKAAAAAGTTAPAPEKSPVSVSTEELSPTQQTVDVESVVVNRERFEAERRRWILTNDVDSAERNRDEAVAVDDDAHLSESASDGESDEGGDGELYERERQRRIAQNAERLRSLGLATTAALAAQDLVRALPAASTAVRGADSSPVTTARRLRRRRQENRSANLGPASVRRSARLNTKREGEAYAVEARVAAIHAPEAPLADDLYTDRSVLESLKTPENGVSVDRGALRLVDASLKRAYSIDVRHNVLIAGGKDGHASVFAIDGGGGGSGRLLMSTRLHSGWISEVQFVDADNAKTLRVLSAGNDGCVRLWDCGALEERSGRPRELCCDGELHRGGIFSLHERGGDVLTGGKDRRAALCRLAEASLRRVAALNELHGGVVKCVRWSPRAGSGGGGGDVFASACNDGAVRVVDVRGVAGGGALSPALAVARAHDGAVNAVEWHPTNGWLLLSAGFDAFVHLWDVRRADHPLRSLAGHTAKARSSCISHPVFTGGGAATACAGEGTGCVSVYDTATGECVGRVDVAGDASALQATCRAPSELACAAGGAAGGVLLFSVDPKQIAPCTER